MERFLNPNGGLHQYPIRVNDDLGGSRSMPFSPKIPQRFANRESVVHVRTAPLAARRLPRRKVTASLRRALEEDVARPVHGGRAGGGPRKRCVGSCAGCAGDLGLEMVLLICSCFGNAAGTACICILDGK